MPKSKNRRKPKRQGQQTPQGGTSVSSENQAAGSESNTSSSPKREKVGMLQFFRQVRDEGQKITWTSRNETMVSTIMVLIMVAIASVFFLLVDQILRYIIPLILNLNA